MLQFMPTLVLRTQYTAVAVEVNGALLGECSPESHIALPLSQNAEYYIALSPLQDTARRYYGVMRKLSVREGKLLPPMARNIEVFAWPGGVYEAVIPPGVLPPVPIPAFPFTVDQLELANGMLATLYYENGLRLAIEEGPRIRYGAMLCAGRTGRLIAHEGGVVAQAMEGPPTLLVLDEKRNERLRVQADEIVWQDGEALCIKRLSTLRGHERRQRWVAQVDGSYRPEPAERGFFTHTPPPPSPGAPLLRAFCEAVREGFYEEARSYLTPGLQEGLDMEELHAFLGPFSACRAPMENADRAIGLCSPREDGFQAVRVFSFTMENGLIDDIEAAQ